MSTVKEVKERFKMPQPLEQLATNMRELFQASSGNGQKVPEVLLLFAYNGTGKTRLSMEFTRQGAVDDKSDTLYFNAFTEDLFSWDNDLENDEHRVLKLNSSSRFFSGAYGMEMETRIRASCTVMWTSTSPSTYRHGKFLFPAKKMALRYRTLKFPAEKNACSYGASFLPFFSLSLMATTPTHG